MIVNKSMFPVTSSFGSIKSMSERMDQLQVQFGTGKKAQTLADMGSTRSLSLTLRAKLGTIEGYKQSQDTVNLRLTVLNKAMTRLDTIESEQRALAVPGNRGTGNINLATSTTQSAARLDEVLTLLSSEVNGRYLMGGNETGGKPVATPAAALDGEAGKAGFRTVANERRAADLGTDGLGRLDLTVATDTATLAEDGTHPFGFKLSALSTTSAAVTVAQPAGAPKSSSFEFTALPLEGETVTIGLTLPDGTADAITLKAVTGTPAAGEFQIGTSANATAANFGAALGTALTTEGQTTLAAASTYAAASNFFAGKGETVMRASGGPPATALVAANPATTVMWYTGEDSTGTARQTVGAKIDDATTINYGVQANEHGLVELVRSLAAFAVESFPNGDANAGARYDAMASRQITHLSESNNNQASSIEEISASLSMAQVTLHNTQERQGAYKVQLETVVADTEGVNNEEIAMEILALKTRLEASYATTAAVAQLSLVNYLR
ncbi:MAG: hypothetical protein JWR75_72 [Devosia sp.]|nr:hypothetical protein [Devosia sp.]